MVLRILIISCNSIPTTGPHSTLALTNINLKVFQRWLIALGFKSSCAHFGTYTLSSLIYGPQPGIIQTTESSVYNMLYCASAAEQFALQEWPSPMAYRNYDKDATLPTIMMHHLKRSRWNSHRSQCLWKFASYDWHLCARLIFSSIVPFHCWRPVISSHILVRCPFRRLTLFILNVL